MVWCSTCNHVFFRQKKIFLKELRVRSLLALWSVTVWWRVGLILCLGCKIWHKALSVRNFLWANKFLKYPQKTQDGALGGEYYAEPWSVAKERIRDMTRISQLDHFILDRQATEGSIRSFVWRCARSLKSGQGAISQQAHFIPMVVLSIKYELWFTTSCWSFCSFDPTIN